MWLLYVEIQILCEFCRPAGRRYENYFYYYFCDFLLWLNPIQIFCIDSAVDLGLTFKFIPTLWQYFRRLGWYIFQHFISFLVFYHVFISIFMYMSFECYRRAQSEFCIYGFRSALYVAPFIAFLGGSIVDNEK